MGEFAVENARILHRGRLVEGALVVSGGRVERVVKIPPRGLRRIDGRGRLLLPGAVDLHVHFRDLGQAAKEDWDTGSAAAAAGGVTTVVEMPNTRPPATTPEAFGEKVAAARKRSRVDFALAGGYDGTNLKALRRLWRAGAAAFGEIFMHSLDPPDLERGLQAILRLGAPAILHAEARGGRGASPPSVAPCGAPRPVRGAGRPLSPRPAPPLPPEDRPPECEIEAVKWLASRFAGRRLHIAHVSTPEGLGAARAAGFTAEVTPHHLLLTEKDRRTLGPLAWCHPPLRDDGRREMLWGLVRRGFGDAVASDHAPHRKGEKEGPERPPGMPGVETMVPLVLRAVRRRRLSLNRAVDLLSRGPAAVLDLDAKGSLETGKDADFMLVDLKKERTIRARDLHSKCGWTPYEGWKGVFPEEVYVRGEAAVKGGEVVGKPGAGRFIPGKGHGKR